MLHHLQAILAFYISIIIDTSVGRPSMTNLNNSIFPPCACRPSIGRNFADENIFKFESSKHLFICIVESSEITEFFVKYPLADMNMNVVFTQEYDMQNFMARNRSMSYPPHVIQKCSALIKLLPNNTSSSAREEISGPGICIPIPYAEIPVSSLLPPYDMERAISLSLTIGAISALHHFEDVNASAVGNTATPQNSSVAKVIGIILKSLARRRVEECSEKTNWPLGSFSNISTATDRDIHSFKYANWTNTSYILPYESKFGKKKVYGLIIWIGTKVKSHLLNSQLKVLQLQNQSLPASKKVFGWAATEDSYDCRVANDTRVCSHSYGYHWMLPSTQLAFRALTGWGCGQRRPLRYHNLPRVRGLL